MFFNNTQISSFGFYNLQKEENKTIDTGETGREWISLGFTCGSISNMNNKANFLKNKCLEIKKPYSGEFQCNSDSNPIICACDNSKIIL